MCCGSMLGIAGNVELSYMFSFVFSVGVSMLARQGWLLWDSNKKLRVERPVGTSMGTVELV